MKMKNMNMKKKLGMVAVLISMVVGALGAMPAMASDVPDNMISAGAIPECSRYEPQKLGPGQSCVAEIYPASAVALDFNFAGKGYLELHTSPGQGKCALKLESHQTGARHYADDGDSLTGLKGIHLVTTLSSVPYSCSVTFVGK